MSVGSVSGVSFGTNGIMRHDDALTREAMASYGPYSSEQMGFPGAPQEKKKGSFLGGVVKLVATAVIVGGAAIAARRLVPALGKEKISTAFLEDIAGKLKGKEKVKFGDKAKYYFAKSTDWLDKNTYVKAEQYIAKVKAEKAAKKSPAGDAPSPSAPPAPEGAGGSVDAKA